MNLIVAVDRDWGIGRDNGLLASVPGDMAYFKEKTLGHVVVCGRKTLESFPHKRGLPKRTNIVLTSNPDFEAERCEIAHSEEELAEMLAPYESDDIFIIGGESIYKRFYERCDKLYVTKLDGSFGADRFMVNLDEDDRFEITWESEPQEDNGISYRFCLYERKKQHH